MDQVVSAVSPTQSDIGSELKFWTLSEQEFFSFFAHQYDAKSGTNGKVSAIHAFYLTDTTQSDMNIMAGGA